MEPKEVAKTAAAVVLGGPLAGLGYVFRKEIIAAAAAALKNFNETANACGDKCAGKGATGF